MSRSVTTGDFIKVTNLDNKSKKKYVIFKISPKQIKSYYNKDYRDQLSLLYSKGRWRIEPQSQNSIDEISRSDNIGFKIKFRKNPLVDGDFTFMNMVTSWKGKGCDFFHKIPTNYEERKFWSALSINPNLTINDVIKYKNRPLNWSSISANPSITPYDVETYPELPWIWGTESNDYIMGLSNNPNITEEFILMNLEKPWSWTQLT